MRDFFSLRNVAVAATACLCGFLGKVDAALPSMPQSMREIEAILSDPLFVSSEVINESLWSIEKTPTGYTLTTQHFVIPVEVHYLPPQNIGPVPFEFQIGDLIAKDAN